MKDTQKPGERLGAAARIDRGDLPQSVTRDHDAGSQVTCGIRFS